MANRVMLHLLGYNCKEVYVKFQFVYTTTRRLKMEFNKEAKGNERDGV